MSSSSSSSSSSEEIVHAPIPLNIYNVVCTGAAHRRVNIVHVAMSLHAKLDFSRFPACIAPCRYPKVTHMLFESGQLLITGAKNINDAMLSAYLFFERINRDLKIHLQLYSFTVQNMVCGASMGFPLNMDLFFDDNKTRSTWNPEEFGGLCWRTCTVNRSGNPIVTGYNKKGEAIEKNAIAFVISSSGKFVATGIKTHEQINMAAERATIFHKYRLGQEYRQMDESRKRKRYINPSVSKASNKKKKQKQSKLAETNVKQEPQS